MENFSNNSSLLYDAALKGDVPSLLALLEEDPLILDRFIIHKSASFTQSPLHVAAYGGHLKFVTEILEHKPELAEQVDQSKGASPLHVASEKGHLEIVKILLEKKPNVCFVRGRDGRNPVHIAAIEGHTCVLEELIRVKPEAIRMRTYDRETVLHLCVKHNQPKALEVLLSATDDAELLNSMDNDDNTALHLAVAAYKQHEIVKHLLTKEKRLEINAINRNGSTPMDAFIHSKKYDENDKKIKKCLKHANALRAKDTIHGVWLEKQRNALMVVASLIATMAFQVGVNPPGGVWQDGKKAGASILADVNPEQYGKLITWNTIGLVSSQSVILLLISGLRCKQLSVAILMVTMWVAVTATTMTYLTSTRALSENTVSGDNKYDKVRMAIQCSLTIWQILMAILLLSHAIRNTAKFTKKVIKLVIKVWRMCFAAKDKSTDPPSPPRGLFSDFTLNHRSCC